MIRKYYGERDKEKPRPCGAGAIPFTGLGCGLFDRCYPAACNRAFGIPSVRLGVMRSRYKSLSIHGRFTQAGIEYGNLFPRLYRVFQGFLGGVVLARICSHVG